MASVRTGHVSLTDECLFFFLSCPQLTAATDRINSLREEQEQLRQENESILQSSQKKEEVRKHLHVTATNPPPNLKKKTPSNCMMHSVFSRQPFRTVRWSWRHTNRVGRAWMRCITWFGSSIKRKNTFARSGANRL